MKIISKIAEKILSHCSKCGQCPMAKIVDTQAEPGVKGETPTKKTLAQEAKNKPLAAPSQRRSPERSEGVKDFHKLWKREAVK